MNDEGALRERGHWALWLAVLPGALAAWVLMTVTIAFTAWAADVPAYVAYFANGVGGPYVFVLAGGAIAPWAKMEAAVGLALVAALIAGASIFYLAQRPEQSLEGWVDALILALSIVAAGVAVFKVREEFGDQ